jgi:hypothetical protein
MGGDAFGIDHGLIRSHVEVEVLLMHAAKHPQVGPQPCPRSLAAIAVDFAAAIPIRIPSPLMEVLSQISILGAKSGKSVSAIQRLTDHQTLEKANLRQNRK